jgi:hypothetical protein
LLTPLSRVTVAAVAATMTVAVAVAVAATMTVVEVEATMTAVKSLTERQSLLSTKAGCRRRVTAQISTSSGTPRVHIDVPLCVLAPLCIASYRSYCVCRIVSYRPAAVTALRLHAKNPRQAHRRDIQPRPSAITKRRHRKALLEEVLLRQRNYATKDNCEQSITCYLRYCCAEFAES